MHGHCSSCIPYFINFTFCAFFSLSSLCKTNWLLSSILVIFFLRYTQTQTQTHRQIITKGALSWSRVQDKLFELSCRVMRISLIWWVRASSIRRVLWILGPSLKRHNGGEVSRGLKKSTCIRFSLFFFFFFVFVLGVMWVLMVDRWCGFCEKEEEKKEETAETMKKKERRKKRRYWKKNA